MEVDLLLIFLFEAKYNSHGSNAVFEGFNFKRRKFECVLDMGRDVSVFLMTPCMDWVKRSSSSLYMVMTVKSLVRWGGRLGAE